MSNNGKIAIIAASAVAGAALIVTGVYLGVKYIPYVVEEARHRARNFELDHREQFTAARKAAETAKKKVAEAIPHR